MKASKLLNKIKEDTKGQLMIESIVAITIGVVALLGVLNLLTQAFGVNQDVGQKLVATYLASEGIEVTKSLVDANYINDEAWNKGLSVGSYEFAYNTSGDGDFTAEKISSDPSTKSTTKLYKDPSTGLYSYSASGDQTQFRRTIQITEDPSSLGTGVEIGVVSVVEWTTRGGGTDSVSLEDHFFDWRPEIQ